MARTRGSLPLLTALLVVPAVRADPPTAGSPQFEVTSFVGYRVGGNFSLIDTGTSVRAEDHASLALALDVRVPDWTQYELFYGRESTVLAGNAFAPSHIKVEYLHLGGTVALGQSAHLEPYLAGGLGVTRLTPDSAAGSDDTRFSISLALGLRVPLNPHFSLRLEGRGFLTPVGTNSAFFCRSDQSGALCEVRANGSLFLQFDFLAGATYAF